MKSILFSLMMLPMLSFASGVFIGNSGDGVKVDGKIYLYDLYLNSTFTNPYIGSEISDVISYHSWRVEHLKALGIDTSLLLRKISDIESLKTGLGVFLLVTMENYSWNYSPLPLPLLSDTSPIIDVERVPLARRVQSSIYIDANNFSQMDPVQKVALIIHEAFYSLVKVECTDLKCRQNSISAQSLTGFVFDETSYVCPVYKGDCLGSVREQLLDIDWRASSFTGPQMIYMKYVDKNGRLSKSLDISLYDSDLAEIRNVNYAPVSKVLCRSIVRNGLQSIAGFNFMLVMDRSSYIVNSKLYRSDSEQTAIKILFRRPRCGYQAGVLSEKKCVEELNKIFSRWYDKSSIDTSVDCLH